MIFSRHGTKFFLSDKECEAIINHRIPLQLRYKLLFWGTTARAIERNLRRGTRVRIVRMYQWERVYPKRPRKPPRNRPSIPLEGGPMRRLLGAFPPNENP